MGRNIKLICHGTKHGKEGLIKEKHVCYYQNKVQCIIANTANILTNALIKSFSFLICLPLLKISKKTKTTNEQTKTKKTKTTTHITHTHTNPHISLFAELSKKNHSNTCLNLALRYSTKYISNQWKARTSEEWPKMNECPNLLLTFLLH